MYVHDVRLNTRTCICYMYTLMHMYPVHHVEKLAVAELYFNYSFFLILNNMNTNVNFTKPNSKFSYINTFNFSN